MSDPFALVLLGGITATTTPFGEGGWWRALERVFPGHRAVSPAWEPTPGCSTSDLADRMAAHLPDGSVLIGASLGGLVGLALAARHPEKVRTLVSISAGRRPDTWGTGVRHLQRELVRDALAAGDPTPGMERARQLGMLTYRGRAEIGRRFGRFVDGRPPIADYLDHHGRKFAKSFDVERFLMLSEAIDRCSIDVSPITARVEVIGVPGDLLFPFTLQRELREALDAHSVPGGLHTLIADTGHDAFVANQEGLANLLIGLFRENPP